jgi:hypothetical protein
MKNLLYVIFALAVFVVALSFAGFACGGGPDEVAGPTPTPALNGSEWAYYQQGNVSSSSYCGYVSDYQMKLVLHYQDGDNVGEHVYLNRSCREDFGDVRFTEEDGETPLNYWIQKVEPGIRATVWVKFNSIQEEGTGFHVYYGNPEAASAANGYKTFMIFNDGASLDNWLEFESMYDFDWKIVKRGDNNVIRCTSAGSGGWSNLYYNATTGTDFYVAECVIWAQEGLTNTNYQQGIGYYLDYPMASWIDFRDHDYWRLRDRQGENISQPDTGFDARKRHEYSFVKNGNSWELFVDGESKVTREANEVGQNIGMYANLGSAGHWVEFDDFRVRSYCFPGPAFNDWGEPVLMGEAPVFPTTEAGTVVEVTPTMTEGTTPEATFNATPGTTVGSTPTMTEAATPTAPTETIPEMPGYSTPEPEHP